MTIGQTIHFHFQNSAFKIPLLNPPATSYPPPATLSSLSTRSPVECGAYSTGLDSRPLTPQTHTFTQCLHTQFRVISALLMREMITRYGRHNIGFLWLFVEPMIFTLGVTILWNLMGHHKSDGASITEFVLTGYSTVLLWRNMPARCVGALMPNFSLMFHRQVKPIDVYFARILLEFLGATTSFMLLTILFHFIGLVSWPHDQITMWTGWILLAWYAASLSLFIGALSERFEIIDKFWHPLMYLLLPLSGSFFIVSALPPKLRDLVLLQPTAHCAEMVRAGYFGPTHEWTYSIGYVVAFNMVLMFLGLIQVRHVSKTLVLAE
jgi:ABC-type polysaccharide/polyol phosphate export permease